MLCTDCNTVTQPRWAEIRGVRIPVCPCRPRHIDMWWFCHCVECAAYRVHPQAQNWLDDYNPVRRSWRAFVRYQIQRGLTQTRR